MAEEKDKAIEEKVKEVVAEQFGVEKNTITLETSFTEDLNADSLDQVELIMKIQDKYNLEIPDEDAEKIQTVGAAVDYIKNHYKT